MELGSYPAALGAGSRLEMDTLHPFLSFLHSLSPINTAPWCGKNALAAVYNLSLQAYLSQAECAARGDGSHVTLSAALWAGVGGAGCGQSFLTVTNSGRA